MSNRTKNIVFGLLYYILIPLLFFYLYLFSLGGVIGDFSNILRNIYFILVPILILFIPIILTIIFKQKFYKTIIISLKITIIYFILLVITRLCIITYMSTFTFDKWNNYMSLRYLMVDDLDKNNSLIGKSKDEIIKELGMNSIYDEKMCYTIRTVFIAIDKYCIEFDEKDIAIKTYKYSK